MEYSNFHPIPWVLLKILSWITQTVMILPMWIIILPLKDFFSQELYLTNNKFCIKNLSSLIFLCSFLSAAELPVLQLLNYNLLNFSNECVLNLMYLWFRLSENRIFIINEEIIDEMSIFTHKLNSYNNQ